MLLPFPKWMTCNERGKRLVHIAVDDSDTLGTTDVVSLSALAANDESWVRFAERWKALLREHDIPFLHCADFLNRRGPYRIGNAPDDPARRVEILAEFSQIIKDEVDYAYVFAIHKPSYDALIKGASKWVNAQTFCFHRLIGKFCDQFNDHMLNERISFLIDDSAKQSQHMLKLWQDLRHKQRSLQELFVGISFCDDKYMFPIQGADLLANAVVKEIRRGPEAFSSESPFRAFSPIDKPGRLVVETEWWREEDVAANADYISQTYSRP